MVSSPPFSSSRRIDWLLLLPKFGVVLLLAAVLSLLWLLHQNEVDEEHDALVKDVLWLEQNLRFHLAGHEEQLTQLAVDLGSRPERDQVFRPRIDNLLRNNPTLLGVIWLNPDQARIDARPPLPSPEGNGIDLSAQAADMATRLGRRAYSDTFASGDAHVFEMALPIYADNRPTGMLIARYSLQGLLNHLVPWWFTEKYQVRILDGNDAPLAAKSNVQSTPTQSYSIPLDPPGYGVKLLVTSHQTRANPLQRILAAAIIVLAGGVFWSLWAVRDLMRKRSRAEEALRAEHAFRKAMEDSLTVGMRARDLTGKIIYVNPAFCRMTGFSSEELVGHLPPMPYWPEDQIEETFAIHRTVMAGEAPSDGFEITLKRKSNERFHALIYEAPLIDGNGRHTGWMGSVIDVTERKRAEEMVRQHHEQLQFTSRLVTMGEMASTLAHELNQPLSAIASYNTGCLNLLESDNLEPLDLRQALEKVGVQAQRAGRIIRRVHDFVRKSEPKLAPCRIEEVIDDCLGFVELDARRRQVRIDRVFGDLPEVIGDRLMLEQVLLNLIRNGMDAMAETPEDLRWLSISVTVADAMVSVRVADNGCGISDAVRDKLFTAFFSTKPGGMGVGLSICRSIIELHRGHLWVDPNLDSPTGCGTIFAFTLPLKP